MHSIADRGEFDATLQSDRPALVVFTAAWCKACRAISPMLQRLAEELSDDMVKAACARVWM
jgi:thioredoxin 1